MMMEKCYNPPKKPLGSRRSLFLSDIHNLHQRVHTSYIAESTWAMIEPYLSSIDALYITGDFWDDFRASRQEVVHIATGLISKILGAAKIHKFGVRVLNGTPSHDHGQSKLFVTLNSGIGADVKYLEGIGVFYDEYLQMDVGWVEDEYRVNANDTAREF